MRMQVQSLVSLSELRIGVGHKLRCRLHMQLGFGITVAMVEASSCSSYSTSSLGTSICHGCSTKKKKKKTKKQTSEREVV